MTTVIDRELYKIYKLVSDRKLTSETEDVISFVQFIAERLAPEDIDDNADVGKIIKAIIDGEDVELKEPKYRVPLPGLKEFGEQLYLYQYDDGRWKMVRKSELIDSRSVFSYNEIPEEYRQWAVEVQE